MAVSEPGEPSPEGDEREPGRPGSTRPDAVDTGRVLALSDGVFAIAATLLVLDLRVPDGLDAAGVTRAIKHLTPAVGGYALSYVLIGLTWLAHHRLFRLISPINERVARLNLLFLGTVSVLPFVTSLLARYGDQRLPTALYAAVIAAIFAFEVGMIGVAGWQGAITDHAAARGLRARALGTALVFALSIAVVALDTSWAASAAKYLWIAVWPARILASRLARWTTARARRPAR